MKFLFMLMMCFPVFLAAQDVYFISHKKGVVIKKGQKQPLKVGDAVYLTDSLSYDKPESYLSVCSPVKGNRILQRDKKAIPPKQGEFFLAVKDLLAPATKTVTLGVRAGRLNSMFDLTNFFRSFSRLSPMLVVDYRRIPLNGTNFPDRANQFFYITYRYDGEAIDKKLSFKEPASARDTLFLLINENLYSVDGKPVDPEKPESLALYSRVENTDKNTLVAPLHIRYCTTETILPELQVIYKTFKESLAGKLNKDVLLEEELRAHLATYWGQVDDETFIRLFKQLH